MPFAFSKNALSTLIFAAAHKTSHVGLLNLSPFGLVGSLRFFLGNSLELNSSVKHLLDNFLPD